jgi:hypothetical protein
MWAGVAKPPHRRTCTPGTRTVAEEILDEEVFDNRVEEATNEERRYLATIADLGDGPQSTGEIRAHAGYKQRASSGKARQALIRKGLVYVPKHRTVDFTVPHFAAFMCRRYPLASLLRTDEDEG